MRPNPRVRPRIYPVRLLTEQIAALDAAMLVAVTSTEVGAVHKLRTTTRRVQAHMALLDLLAQGDRPLPVPAHAEETRAVLRHLRRVRRAAGAVRDLDVQGSIIRLDAPAKAAVHKGTPGDTVRRQAKKLRKMLEREREHEAGKLVNILKTQEHDLAAALRALEQAVQAVSRSSVSASSLVDHVSTYFRRQAKPMLHTGGKHGIESMQEDDLHAVRKLAKLSRYMLESAPQGSAAQQEAQRYEALQEAGGRWHDWLLLQQLSQHMHGRKAELTHRYTTHAEAALAEYRLRLHELLPALQVEAAA